MLYSISTCLKDEYHYVEFTKHQDEIIDFFVYNKGNDDFTQNTELRFKAQKGFKKNNILKYDYLDTFMNVSIFSENFKNCFCEKFSEDLSFYPCIVECEGAKYDFFIGKTYKSFSLINELESDYFELSDGQLIIDNPVFNVNYPEFYIARDVNDQTILVISENAARLIQKKKLNIQLNRLKSK